MKTGINIKNKLTKREFLLITLFIVALEGFLLFNYILRPSYNEYVTEKNNVKNNRLIVLRLEGEYKQKAKMEEQLKALDKKLVDLNQEIPPYVSQEEVILLVDKVSSREMLSVQMISFESMPAAVNTAAAATQAENTSDAANTEAASAQVTAPALLNQDITLSFTGSYGAIYNFIKALEDNLRKVSVKDITLQRQGGDMLAGQMKLSFISLIDPSANQQFKMDDPVINGKSDLFQPYAGYSEGAVLGIAQQGIPLKQPNFYLLIHNYLDNAPKVILAEYPKAATELSSNENSPVSVKLALTGSGGKFTYSYTLGGTTRAEQTPIAVKDGVIRVEVISQPRKSGQDKVAATFDISNQTDVPVEIVVKNDDKNLPRFKIGNKTGEVIVK